ARLRRAYSVDTGARADSETARRLERAHARPPHPVRPDAFCGRAPVRALARKARRSLLRDGRQPFRKNLEQGRAVSDAAADDLRLVSKLPTESAGHRLGVGVPKFRMRERHGGAAEAAASQAR